MVTLFTTRIIKKASEGKNKILDAGCGHGVQAVYLGRKRPNSSVTGYDISPEEIEKANELKGKYGVANVEFFVVTHDDFEPSYKMDMIYTTESLVGEDELSYIIDPLIESEPLLRRRFSRFNKMLLPGGIYILSWGSTAKASNTIIELARDCGLRYLDAVQDGHLSTAMDGDIMTRTAMIFERT